MARNTQFTVAKGETFRAPATLKNSDATPRDITDYTFVGQIKPTYSDNTEYPFTIEKTSSVSGSILISLDTQNIPAGRYPYNIFIMSGSVTRSMLEGSFIIRESTQ